jgi:CGNR zinc finger
MTARTMPAKTMPAKTMPQRRPVPALVALSNAARPRRPAGALAATAEDPFGRHSAAAALLEPLGLAQALGPDELDDLRALARETSAIADATARGEPPPSIDTINRLAAQASVSQQLRIEPGGGLTVEVRWHAAGAVPELACQIMAELAGLDPTRLRHCAREACDLLFYDTTRSNNQRWHSESPCGLRERQERWRKASQARPAR